MTLSPENKSCADRYQLQQQRYWEQLRQELLQYRNELGITNKEMAKALEISRQPLVSFMKGDRHDLPIQRFHLIRFWDRITSHSQPKNLSNKHLNNRQKLCKDDLNRLLKAGGFLPEKDELQLEIKPERYQQIQRIVSGLSNVPTNDDTDFIDLVDSLEAEFVTKAFGFKKYSQNLREEIYPNQNFSEHAVLKWIENWIDENLYTTPKAHIEQRFKRALSKLIRQGRFNIKSREIFELYLSILENDRIDKKLKSNHRIRVSQCQFTDLSFSITDLFSPIDNDIKAKLIYLFMYAEGKLRIPEEVDEKNSIEEKERYLRQALEEKVTNVSVTCTFRLINNEKENIKKIKWSYSSSATHFENMFTAIHQGMGYEKDLDLINFSSFSLGNRVDSLVKSSTTFKSRKTKTLHQGTWIDRSTVIATAQSVVVAAISWLANNLPDLESYSYYQEACASLAEMEHDLIVGSKVLSDYILQQAEKPLQSSAREINNEVITKIEKLRHDVLEKYPILNSWFISSIDRKYCWAKISYARSCHVEGNLKEAAKCLNSAEKTIKDTEICDDIPLLLRLKLERMLQDFYGGDFKFISERLWRTTFQKNIEDLQYFIYNSQPELAKLPSSRRLDVSIYRCASEIFARTGRLDLTFSTSDEVEHLRQAANNLLIAAHYSSKIGERQRCAHWLANACRAYCRLGDERMSSKVAKSAKQILQLAIDHRYGDQYKESIMAEIHICYGEKISLN